MTITYSRGSVCPAGAVALRNRMPVMDRSFGAHEEIAQLGRATAVQAVGHGFESRFPDHRCLKNS